MALLSNEETLFKELNLQRNKNSDQPKDLYNFLLHRIINIFESNVNRGVLEDEKTKGSYYRLNKFIWDRSHLKKAILTIPYNVTPKSMKKYLTDGLKLLDYDKDNSCHWYTDNVNHNNQINDHDALLLITVLRNMVFNDFEKIKKLSKYLINVATLFNSLQLPITWYLPTGLTVIQSYMQTKTTTIVPFAYSRLKLKISSKQDYDKKKQIRALMPNLIHSLDATSLALLFSRFSKEFHEPQFFSIHDCFGTTADKVFLLKTLLASVYTDIYSENHYLHKFDKDLFKKIKENRGYKVDIKERKVEFPDGNNYILHDIEWVINNKNVNKTRINKIDNQFILIKTS